MPQMSRNWPTTWICGTRFTSVIPPEAGKWPATSRATPKGASRGRYSSARCLPSKVYQGVIDNWWRQGMMGGAKAHHDCIKAFSETDFTEDLQDLKVPVLIMPGRDQRRSAGLLQGVTGSSIRCPCIP
jgi:hypothetical protein